MCLKARRLSKLTLGPVIVLLGLLGTAAWAQQAERWKTNMSPGVMEVSAKIYDLHMAILWICVVIGIVVFGVMMYSIYTHRKSNGFKSASFHESTTVEVVWTVIPFLILIFMAVPATTTLLDIYNTDDAELDIIVTSYLDLLAITGTQNRGNLVSPAQQIDTLTMSQNGEVFKYSEQEQKWTFLIPGGQFCDSDCEQTLYLSRQISISMDKESLGVRRYYLNLEGDNGGQLREFIHEEYPHLEILESNWEEFQTLLAAAQLPVAGASEGVFYVVDPNGWIMMLYSRDNTFKDTIKDMKFLLKNTI